MEFLSIVFVGVFVSEVFEKFHKHEKVTIPTIENNLQYVLQVENNYYYDHYNNMI